jgi:hypothetical protein
VTTQNWTITTINLAYDTFLLTQKNMISVRTIFVDLGDVSCRFILEWGDLKLNKTVNSQNTSIYLRWCVLESMMDLMK